MKSDHLGELGGLGSRETGRPEVWNQNSWVNSPVEASTEKVTTPPPTVEVLGAKRNCPSLVAAKLLANRKGP